MWQDNEYPYVTAGTPQGYWPGSQVEVVERDDGVIELHPVVTVPADQAWFWSQRWQLMEKEVDGQYATGLSTAHESGADLLAHLDDPSSDE